MEVWNVCQRIHAFVCKDTETRGRGEVRCDDSEREQSRWEGPGDKLRTKGGQRRHRELRTAKDKREIGPKKKNGEKGGGVLDIWILI